MEKPLIYDLDLPQLEATLLALGEPANRARQVWQGLYQKL
jgi:adenine C2-methylase RlmN of 23S rRNA A2503 and tRNA A37